MDTHSVELQQYKLEELSIVRNDTGKVVKPLGWETPTKGGHHISATLTFPSTFSSGESIVDSGTKNLEVVIKNIWGNQREGIPLGPSALKRWAWQAKS